MSKKRLAIIVGVLIVLGYPAWLGFQIWDQSHKDEPRPADAIVVLGAAQYDGEPSPVFRARLDHAAFLYGEDLSDTVIVTGGKQEGDRFTEAEAGAAYLVENEIPATDVLQENEGTTTWESLKNVRQLAASEGIDSVLLVSDPLHTERIKRMAHDLGFDEAYASWASYVELNRSRTTKAKELLHEIVSLIAYEFFQR